MTRARRPSPQTVAVVLALADNTSGWRHGYDLCKQLDLKAGTVYPILMRLHERGQVQTTWETDPPAGRPARHLYRLSDAGAELAEELRAAATTEARAAGKGPSPRPALGGAPGMSQSRVSARWPVEFQDALAAEISGLRRLGQGPE